jgi:hypothetical protein
MFGRKFVVKFKTCVLLKSCRLWDDEEKYDGAGQATDDHVIRRMRIACCASKATDTQSEYVILIAFTLQQWFHERTSILRNAYIAYVYIVRISEKLKV